jgi:hypothetical protein
VDWPGANLGAIAATGFNYIHIDINTFRFTTILRFFSGSEQGRLIK